MEKKSTRVAYGEALVKLGKINKDVVVLEADLSKLTSEAEHDLIRMLNRYPEEIARAADDRAPHHVARFVHELAGDFHSFYNQCRIIGVDGEIQQARLQIVRAVQSTLKHGLNLLGISAPERM